MRWNSQINLRYRLQELELQSKCCAFCSGSYTFHGPAQFQNVKSATHNQVKLDMNASSSASPSLFRHHTVSFASQVKA